MNEGPPDSLSRCTSLTIYVLSHMVVEGGGTSFKAPSIQVSVASSASTGTTLLTGH